MKNGNIAVVCGVVGICFLAAMGMPAAQKSVDNAKPARQMPQPCQMPACTPAPEPTPE